MTPRSMIEGRMPRLYGRPRRPSTGHAGGLPGHACLRTTAAPRGGSRAATGRAETTTAARVRAGWNGRHRAPAGPSAWSTSTTEESPFFVAEVMHRLGGDAAAPPAGGGWRASSPCWRRRQSERECCRLRAKAASAGETHWRTPLSLLAGAGETASETGDTHRFAIYPVQVAVLRALIRRNAPARGVSSCETVSGGRTSRG